MAGFIQDNVQTIAGAPLPSVMVQAFLATGQGTPPLTTPAGFPDGTATTDVVGHFIIGGLVGGSYYHIYVNYLNDNLWDYWKLAIDPATIEPVVVQSLP